MKISTAGIPIVEDCSATEEYVLEKPVIQDQHILRCRSVPFGDPHCLAQNAKVHVCEEFMLSFVADVALLVAKTADQAIMIVFWDAT